MDAPNMGPGVPHRLTVSSYFEAVSKAAVAPVGKQGRGSRGQTDKAAPRPLLEPRVKSSVKPPSKPRLTLDPSSTRASKRSSAWATCQSVKIRQISASRS